MTNSVQKTAKKAMIATLAVATVATAGIFSGTQNAEAGSRDFWRGAAVGAAGTIIVGSAIRNSRQRETVYVERRRPRTVVVEREVYYNGDAHVNWCLNRYRSYDVRSDTYVPRRGVRRYCNSPYN